MALNKTKLKHQTAFVLMRPREDYQRPYELSDQIVRHLPNCYLVVAAHAQATQAIALRIQDHPIPRDLYGQFPGLGSLKNFLASVTLSALERGDRLSDSALLVTKSACLQRALADQALPAAKLIDRSGMMYGNYLYMEDDLQSARLNKISCSFEILTSLLLIRFRPMFRAEAELVFFEIE